MRGHAFWGALGLEGLHASREGRHLDREILHQLREVGELLLHDALGWKSRSTCLFMRPRAQGRAPLTSRNTTHYRYRYPRIHIHAE